MDTKNITDFLTGDEITGFYYLARADLKSRRDKQGQYLSVDLSDATGQIQGFIWEGAEALAQQISASDIIKVKGSVQSYQGRKQVSITRIRKATEADDVDMSRLVASLGGKTDELWREYNRLATNVVNPFLRSLLRKFTESEDFRINFCKAPGGENNRHGYLGGLLEHTVNVAKACEKIAGIYQDIDRDLLMTAALLHDIGKTQSYKHGPQFELTDEGRLLGHSLLTQQLIRQKMQEIATFSEELAMKLLHIILSAGNAREKAQTIRPMTAEAIVLHRLDQLDGMVNVFFLTKKREQRTGKKWSRDAGADDRLFYFGEKLNND